jgi:protein O-mannosyl-transferase
MMDSVNSARASWTPGLSTTRNTSLILGCILVLAFTLYANTLANGFVYDDHQQVQENPYAQSFRYVGKIFTSTVWSFQGEEGKTNYYRPLMTLVYLLSNKAFQGLPYGFHLINILLNCIVVGLVFLVSARLLGDQIVALGAATLFALHPIHTEVVAWIAALTELELAAFYLASFVCFVRLKDGGPTDNKKMRLMAWLFFGLALLSKEQAITLIVLVTVYEHFYREGRDLVPFRQKFSRYVGFWVIGAAYLIFRAAVLGGVAPVPKHPDVTWSQAILSACALAGRYVTKLFWPRPLLAFYVFHKSESFSDTRFLAGAVIMALTVLLFTFLWRRARIYSFALLWIALTLAPVLNARWMATNVFTERYLYLPSVGFCTLVAGGFGWVFRRPQRIVRWALGSAVAVVGVPALLSVVERNRDWKDDLTLYAQTLSIEPHAAIIRTNLGVLEWERQNREEAERQWRLALADEPDSAVALSNLGLAMLEKQRYEEAASDLQEAIALRPHFAAPHVHLGRVYAAEGNAVDAELQFRRAVEIYPMSAQARNALGKLYFDQGRMREAKEQYQASAEAVPNAEAWNHLGDTYAREAADDKAEQAWRKVLELSPFDVEAHLGLGNLYFANGRNAEAEKEYRAVLLMDPKNPAALAGLAKLSAKAKQVPAALR